MKVRRSVSSLLIVLCLLFLTHMNHWRWRFVQPKITPRSGQSHTNYVFYDGVDHFAAGCIPSAVHGGNALSSANFLQRRAGDGQICLVMENMPPVRRPFRVPGPSLFENSKSQLMYCCVRTIERSPGTRVHSQKFLTWIPLRNAAHVPQQVVTFVKI